MDKENGKKPLLSHTALKAALIFVLSYFVLLAVWLAIKSYYGMAVTSAASYAVTMLKNVDVVEILRNKDIVSVGFIPERYGVTILKTTIDVPTSNYTFNAPLTFAIMAAFYPYLKRKRIYLEALLILVVVHFLFVFSLEAQKLTAYLEAQGYEKPSALTRIFWEFLWGFVDNMVVRFEPFLIGAYLYLFRNREEFFIGKSKTETKVKAPKKPKKRN